MRVWKSKSAYRAKRDHDWEPMEAAVLAARSEGAVEEIFADFVLRHARHLPSNWTDSVRDLCDDRLAELRAERDLRAMDSIVGEIARAI